MSRSSLRETAAAVVAAILFMAPPAAAQQTLVSPAGDSLHVEPAKLRAMLDTARALRADLEADPRVLYTLGFGPPAPADSPREAYPWNAVQPRSDSTVAVTTPGNLREADRAYHNYSVMRMRVVRRDDADDPCDALVDREVEVLSSFVDGWILARTLYGGPAYAPLDELPFARAAGHLPALLAARGDSSVGACSAQWATENAGAIDGYEAWRTTHFLGLVAGPPADVAVTKDPAAGPEPLVPPEAETATGDEAGEGAGTPPDAARPSSTPGT